MVVLARNLEQIENELIPIRNDFPDIGPRWINKLGIDRFYIQQPASACENFFTDSYYTVVKPEGTNEFRRFLEEIKQREIEVTELSQQEEQRYARELSRANSSLNSNGRKFLNESLANRPVLSDKSNSFTFRSAVIGNITYELPSKVFNENILSTAYNEASFEQYRDYSLRTGSQPYADCYGRNRGCDYYGCSKIKIKTGSDDVVVMIKDRNERVVRHAYINERSSYSFSVPDGNYQVFFYNGTGWNPNKQMPSSDCRRLRGGFVSSEQFGKSDMNYLNSVEWTIELIEQIGGNFREKPSSREELF